jgi:hypothetical protein
MQRTKYWDRCGCIYSNGWRMILFNFFGPAQKLFCRQANAKMGRQ